MFLELLGNEYVLIINFKLSNNVLCIKTLFVFLICQIYLFIKIDIMQSQSQKTYIEELR